MQFMLPSLLFSTPLLPFPSKSAFSLIPLSFLSRGPLLHLPLPFIPSLTLCRSLIISSYDFFTSRRRRGFTLESRSTELIRNLAKCPIGLHLKSLPFSLFTTPAGSKLLFFHENCLQAPLQHNSSVWGCAAPTLAHKDMGWKKKRADSRKSCGLSPRSLMQV